jgi:hypothetical protein
MREESISLGLKIHVIRSIICLINAPVRIFSRNMASPSVRCLCLTMYQVLLRLPVVTDRMMVLIRNCTPKPSVSKSLLEPANCHICDISRKLWFRDGIRTLGTLFGLVLVRLGILLRALLVFHEIQRVCLCLFARQFLLEILISKPTENNPVVRDLLGTIVPAFSSQVR